MIIRHKLPGRNYTKIDKNVFSDSELSDGAKVLYGFLCGLRNGGNFTDPYLCKALGISQKSLTRRKKELKDADLLLADQIDQRTFVAYIGYSNYPAHKVKRDWDKEETV